MGKLSAIRRRSRARGPGGLTSLAGQCGEATSKVCGSGRGRVVGGSESRALLRLALLGTRRCSDKAFNGPGPLHRAGAPRTIPARVLRVGVCWFVMGPRAEPWGTPALRSTAPAPAGSQTPPLLRQTTPFETKAKICSLLCGGGAELRYPCCNAMAKRAQTSANQRRRRRKRWRSRTLMECF